MAGIVINLPWAKGDKFHVEAAFSEGAGAYVGLDGGISGKNNIFQRFNGGNVAAAWAIDSVFGTLASTGGATGQNLTRYFTILGAIEHYWTPALRTDLWANYTAADYNDVATTLFCSSPQSPVRRVGAPNAALTGAVGNVVVGCDPDFNVWAVGVRTIWNPAPQFDIGLEVAYTKLETRHDPGAVVLNFAGAGGRAAGCTCRRARACGARSSACSATSGHDRLIIAGLAKKPPVERPGVFASEDTIGPHGNEKNLSAILFL